MADPTADNDEELHTEDPEALKALRANAKRRFTNLIKLTRDLMADNGSRTSLKNRRQDLIGAFQECSYHNNCYKAIRPDDGRSDTWITTIETDLDF